MDFRDIHLHILYMNCDSLDEKKCWNFTGGKDWDLYGIMKVNGKSVRAHRFSFFVHNGYIENEKFVCHTCDNPSCVNPKHLWLGSNSTNQKDSVSKGRQFYSRKTHCKYGHEYSFENTLLQFCGNTVKRRCAECNRKNMRKRYIPRRKK